MRRGRGPKGEFGKELTLARDQVWEHVRLEGRHLLVCGDSSAGGVESLVAFILQQMGKTADIAYDTLPAAHQLDAAELAIPLHHGGKVLFGGREVLGPVGGDDGVGDLFVHVLAPADDGGVRLFAGVGVDEAFSLGFFGSVEEGTKEPFPALLRVVLRGKGGALPAAGGRGLAAGGVEARAGGVEAEP